MRLINTKTLEPETFVDCFQVKYAILSHRWEEDEVLYGDLISTERREQVKSKKGFRKIRECCNLAHNEGFKYAWVDTCCIDKSSSAELQEAINSMFSWYKSSAVCYTYLSDVFEDKGAYEFEHSLWFTRGWTLQELVAPSDVIFYNADWKELTTRTNHAQTIEHITGIPREVLVSGLPTDNRPCIAEIMSWAKDRKTTRVEDTAYSLLGLFDVSMPMLYGEGEKAFTRLQEEIIRNTEDQSIFAWDGVQEKRPSLLATSPDAFPRRLPRRFWSGNQAERRRPHVLTNEGITLELHMFAVEPSLYIGRLNLYLHKEPLAPFDKPWDGVGVLLKQLDSAGRYARVAQSSATFLKTIQQYPCPTSDLVNPADIYDTHDRVWEPKYVTVVRRLRPQEIDRCFKTELYGLQIDPEAYATFWLPRLREGKWDVQCQPQWTLSTKTEAPGFDRETGVVLWHPATPFAFRMLFPEEPDSIFKCKLRWIFFGFTRDFNLWCVLSTNEEFDDWRVRRLAASTEWSEATIKKPAKLLDSEILIHRVGSCSYSTRVGPNMAALHVKPSARFGESLVCFAHVEIQGAEKSMSLAISFKRYHCDQPWQIYLQTPMGT